MAQLGVVWADGIWDTSVWDTSIWEQSAATIAYALKVGASELPVRPGGHRAREVPMADEVVIDINGVARSGITAYRGYMTHVSIETPELDASDLDALYTTLNVGTPLTFTGYLVGGSLTAVVRNLRYVPGDIDRALACDIVQSG